MKNTLEIRVCETISISDVIINTVEKIKTVIINIVKYIVSGVKSFIDILFESIVNYSNPPNLVLETKLNESFRFSFAFVR